MSGAPESTLDQRLAAPLAEVRVVAVLGAHVREHKPAFYVPDYLHAAGLRVIPVNPVFAGRRQWGETFRPTLAEVGEPIDLIDVFRRSEIVAQHGDEILDLDPLPRCVWLQLGIRDESLASRLGAAGIEVIQDRCLMVDHRRLA